MGLHNSNMLLSPYRDGHKKCNVIIFETGDRTLDVISAGISYVRKRTMCNKLLLNDIS